MIKKIEKFLIEYDLTQDAKRLSVAFSGGFDSMCLLHCLIELRKKYKFKLFAFHLNHNWRGEEALREALHCEKFCNLNNIDFYSETLDANEKHTETHARELRYEFFNRAIKKFQIDALFTAHTKSDTAETLIYRLIKGTGIKGLQGISPHIGKIYRPMLDISRKEVENYCKVFNLSPNNDSSNADSDYTRNYIRNEILPKFKKINKNYEESINSLSLLAYEEEQIVKEYLSSLNIYNMNAEINSEIFCKLSNILKKRVIYELFVKYDFEYTQQKILHTLQFINENINSNSGKNYSLDAEYFLFVSSKKICVFKQKEKCTDEVRVTKEGVYNFLNFEFKIEKCHDLPKVFPNDSEFKAYVEINGDFDFTLRTRREGDIIVPLGTSGSMKLKKYLINKNIPQYEKDSIVLLCKSSEILWVSGIGLSDNLKVVNRCTHVITLNNRGKVKIC